MRIDVDIQYNIDKSMYNNIDKFLDGVMYSIARETLDRSYTSIPLSNNVNSGRLRSSSLAYGVQQLGPGHFQIGSTTSYAAYVWNMNNDTTNWTTPGTQSEWYMRYFYTHGNSLVANAVQENKLK